MSNIFIYKDNNYPCDENNVFLSCEYKSVKEFINLNKDDDFTPLFTYKTEVVFEKTLNKMKSKISNLETTILELSEALGFYSELSTTWVKGKSDGRTCVNYTDRERIKGENYAGKRARKALSKHEETIERIKKERG